jgi:hypothetical protein
MKKIVVTFDFDIGSRVITDLGEKGVVVMLALDDSRTLTYCVRTSTSTCWFKAKDLKVTKK